MRTSTNVSQNSEEIELLQELVLRRRARQELEPFTEYTTPGWKAGRLHRTICVQLDRVRRLEIDRLLLLAPPQHGKSTATSRRFPAFLLGHEPWRDCISASATAELAQDFGQDVRDCIASHSYRNIFPRTTLSADSTAKGRWRTAQGGSYYAVGFGGSIFGRGGDTGLIDDPFASWADAQSENARRNAWEWYRGSFYNRIRPGGAIIVIQHRTHEEDLAGHLLEMMRKDGDRWEVVELPALLDDPPWKERYDRAALERLKGTMSEQMWSSLYMQQPQPDEGTFFKREWFWRFDPKKVSKDGHKYTTGDFAVTEPEDGSTPDWTDLGTHVYHDDKLHLCVDGWHGQEESDKWIEALCDQFERHKPFCFFGEGGVIRRAIEPFLRRRIKQRGTYCRLEWISKSKDKAAMARPLQAMASMGQVGIADNDHGERVLHALLKFPGGKPDDPVDMAGLMGLAIDQAHPGLTPEPELTEKPDRYKYVDDDEEVAEWRIT